MRHNCGGTLVEARVMIFPDENSTAYVEVDGLRCNECWERFITPATMTTLLRSLTPGPRA